MLAGCVLPVTGDIFVRWRGIVEIARCNGHTSDQSDALISDCARHHGLVVLTRDIEPFRIAEVDCLDPWLPR
jgi:toxin FitB